MAKKPALTPEEAKKEALGTALTTIEHKYGKGAVMRLSDHPAIRIPVIPTGFHRSRSRSGRGGHPPRQNHGNLRSRIIGQNDSHATPHR